MISEDDRRLINQFADGNGRVKRPAGLNPHALGARSAKRTFWISVLIWWVIYFIVALALEGDDVSTDEAASVGFGIATFAAVAYLIVSGFRGGKTRKLERRWRAALVAQAALDEYVVDKTLPEQFGYATNLAKSYDETLKVDFGLPGILMVDPSDEDVYRPALLLVTDKSVLMTVISEEPLLHHGVNMPREHFRFDFMDDYPLQEDPRPLWGVRSRPDCIRLRINEEQTVLFRSFDTDEGTSEFLKYVEIAANRVRESTYLPPLADLSRGPRPEKRLVRDALEAEEVVALWVRWLGWPDARTTVATGDGGIDVIGTGPTGLAVAQVKFEAKPTGRPQLNALFGAGHGVGATSWLFFTAKGYSEQALDWADQVGMSLFSFTLDGDIQPVNRSAADLFR